MVTASTSPCKVSVKTKSSSCSGGGEQTCFFSKNSRPALGPTLPLFLFENLQTGSGAHPAFCTIGTEFSPGGQSVWGLPNLDHSPPLCAEVKNEWRRTRAPTLRLLGYGNGRTTSLHIYLVSKTRRST